MQICFVCLIRPCEWRSYCLKCCEDLNDFDFVAGRPFTKQEVAELNGKITAAKLVGPLEKKKDE